MRNAATVWGANVLAAILLAAGASAQSQRNVIKLTRDSLFTTNIEGPQVDTTGNLFVVNYLRNGTIGKVEANGSVSTFVTLPEGSTANAIMFNRKGNMLLADWTGHNILEVNMQTKMVSVLCHRDDFNQPNDITINSSGQLFASDPNWKNSTGKLWRVDPDGKATLLKDNMGTTNGIELSPDQKIMYLNESAQRKIWAFDVDDKGGISNQRLFHEFPDYGLDGMKCDSKGNLYVTRHGKGTVVILAPTGQLMEEITLLGEQPSNLVFGGKDRRTVFVTLQDCGCINTFRARWPGRLRAAN